jgi:hypothetical protein
MPDSCKSCESFEPFQSSKSLESVESGEASLACLRGHARDGTPGFITIPLLRQQGVVPNSPATQVHPFPSPLRDFACSTSLYNIWVCHLSLSTFSL